jgi:purine-nucleoside/S-methyl-5'-thioadenosine phosphorylase / adenosine deaminase
MRFSARLSEFETDGVRILVDEGAARRGVLVAFSDRRGGVSRPPYDELNLALRVGDDAAPVEENRRRVAAAAGFSDRNLVLARQVHGANVLEVGPDQRGVIGEGDGLVARVPGLILGMLTADCAPVVVAGDSGIAVLHAGWRGVVAGVIEAGLTAVGSVWGAWIGPSVHSCCYAVGPEVIAKWKERGLEVAGDRIDPGRAAAEILARSGVTEIAVATDCTHCSTRYFSHRRDGVTGRQGGFAALIEAAA